MEASHCQSDSDCHSAPEAGACTQSNLHVCPAGCLLCTDVAARGLDIPDVQWTLQLDAPQVGSLEACFTGYNLPDYPSPVSWGASASTDYGALHCQVHIQW